MKSKIGVILIGFMIIITGCEGGSSIVGSDDVVELSGASFTITDQYFTSSLFTVKGTITNTGDDTYYPPWYIEAEFYSDSTFTMKFGGDRTQMSFSLAPTEQTLWQITYSSDLITESDYPNFKVKNLRAYIND